MSRRELFAALIAAPVVFWRQTPEPVPTPPLTTPEFTPTIDPLEQADTESVSAIWQRIEKESKEVFPLERPRVGALIKLDVKALPDINLALLTDQNNDAYAILWNTDCLDKSLKDNKRLGRTVTEPGPAQGFFDVGVREVEITPVNQGERFDEIEVQRLFDEIEISIGGEKHTLPVLMTRGAMFNNQPIECKTPVESIKGSAREVYDKAVELVRRFDLDKTLESAGEFVGKALGNLGQGAVRGVRQALNG